MKQETVAERTKPASADRNARTDRSPSPALAAMVMAVAAGNFGHAQL